MNLQASHTFMNKTCWILEASSNNRIFNNNWSWSSKRSVRSDWLSVCCESSAVVSRLDSSVRMLWRTVGIRPAAAGGAVGPEWASGQPAVINDGDFLYGSARGLQLLPSQPNKKHFLSTTLYKPAGLHACAESLSSVFPRCSSFSRNN